MVLFMGCKRNLTLKHMLQPARICIGLLQLPSKSTSTALESLFALTRPPLSPSSAPGDASVPPTLPEQVLTLHFVRPSQHPFAKHLHMIP